MITKDCSFCSSYVKGKLLYRFVDSISLFFSDVSFYLCFVKIP